MELLVSDAKLVSGSRWLLCHAVAVFAFLYLPIAVLILYSFNGEGVGGFPPHHLTLDWYRTLFADGPIWDSVLNSLQVALAAMVIALTFGIPAALALERAQFPGKAFFRRLVLLPLILPGIITGLSLLMLFNVMGTKLSLMTIVLGHGTALISVATTEVFAGLQKLDRAQEEASLDLGANYWQTFWRITVPNLKLPIIGAALLIFTLSMDEIAVSFFLIGRDHYFCLFVGGNCVLVPLAHARRECRGGGNKMSANRRDFIKFVVAGAVTAGCPIDLSLVAAQTQTGDAQKNRGADVDGEDNRICHQVRDGKVFTRPPASARHDVVIVGGGVSGLTAAYRLRHRDFLLLEKEPHWGGNAYEMEYEGSVYATGSAFLTKDEYAYPFAKEIGLEPLPINSSDASIIQGELVLDTWGEGLNKLPYPAPVRESFKKFKKEMLAIDVKKRDKELFEKPFTDFLKGYPPELKQWWDNFGPSNWGATSEDTAAALAGSPTVERAESSMVTAGSVPTYRPP